MRRAWFLLVCLPAFAADERDRQVEALWTEYKSLKSNQDLIPQRRRRAIAREMAEIPTPRSRKALLDILDGDRDIRAQIAAMVALGRIADLDSVQAMVKIALRESKTVLPDYLGEALPRVKDPAVGPWVIDKLLDSGHPAIRLSAIQALGALSTPEARVPLLALRERYLKQKAQEIHFLHETIRALGYIGGEGVRAPLLADARDPDWRVRLAAAEVLLVHFRDDECLEAMRALLRDERPIVREIAAIAAGKAKAEPLFPELVLLMREGNLRAKQKTYEALREISGRDFKYAPDAWEKYWKDRKSGRLDAGEEIKADESVSVATYYNFKIFSDRVLFIVDVSGSMQWPEWHPNRIEVARKELVRVLKSLNETTMFNLMVFSGAPMSWQGKGEVPATKRNIEDALAWSENKLKPGGATNTYDTLMRALEENQEIDTIYFLSDGMPSTGKYELAEEILIRLRAANRFRRVIINTIALAIGRPAIESAQKYEDPEEMTDFMRTLAEWNGGSCFDVRKPFTAPPPPSGN